MGLISDGGFTLHYEQSLRALRLATTCILKKSMHGFLDGRDVAPSSGLDFVKKTEEVFVKSA